MLQNHHADKAETCSAMRVHCIKRTVLLGKTMKYDRFCSPWCIISRNNSS